MFLVPSFPLVMSSVVWVGDTQQDPFTKNPARPFSPPFPLPFHSASPDET